MRSSLCNAAAFVYLGQCNCAAFIWGQCFEEIH